MNMLQIGSFAILHKWVILGISFLLGLLFIKVRKSQVEEENKKVFELLLNSMFLLFLIWKGSLILLNPKLVIQSPLSLLYFTGGEKGLFIAILITIFYYIYKGTKIISRQVILQSLIHFSYSVLISYHFLFLFLLEENELYHLLIGSFALIILFLSMKWNKKSQA